MNDKQKKDNQSLKILTILRLDAQRVFERIKYREPEYMQHFSAKRTRDHFGEVFKHRYDDVSVQELMFCGEEVIIGLDQFYTKVDELKWYLMVTEDMPGTVQEHVRHTIRELEEAYELLQLYINAELDSYRPQKGEEHSVSSFTSTEDLSDESPEFPMTEEDDSFDYKLSEG